MPTLTLARAKELLATTTTEAHLFEHAIGVSAAMGAMARHFGQDPPIGEAVGYLHDYDYEQYPEEHLAHTPSLCARPVWTMSGHPGHSNPRLEPSHRCGTAHRDGERACSRWTS